jgi:hypothetical protein
VRNRNRRPPGWRGHLPLCPRRCPSLPPAGEGGHLVGACRVRRDAVVRRARCRTQWGRSRPEAREVRKPTTCARDATARFEPFTLHRGARDLVGAIVHCRQIRALPLRRPYPGLRRTPPYRSSDLARFRTASAQPTLPAWGTFPLCSRLPQRSMVAADASPPMQGTAYSDLRECAEDSTDLSSSFCRSSSDLACARLSPKPATAVGLVAAPPVWRGRLRRPPPLMPAVRPAPGGLRRHHLATQNTPTGGECWQFVRPRRGWRPGVPTSSRLDVPDGYQAGCAEETQTRMQVYKKR